MNKNDALNKSIDSLIDSFFGEDVAKAGENFEVANASKTTADAAIAAAPGMQDDAARGAGRPKQISDVPKNDQDGKRDGQYDASIAANQGEEENEEAKKQAKAIDQTSAAGHMGEKPKMKDPRAGGQVMKSITADEYAQFEAFKKSQAEQEELRKSESLKKADDLRKAELENLVKSAVASAIQPLKQENAELKKSLSESATLVKAMAGQPQRAKSVTGIDAIEKSQPERAPGEQTFSKSDKLNAAEALVMKKSLPMEAVIELENTGTVYRRDWQALIETELEKQNK